MVVKNKGLYRGLLLLLLGIGNVIQVYGLTRPLYKFTIKNETGRKLKLIVDYYEDCEPYSKELDGGKTIEIESPCKVKQVNAFVYTRPEAYRTSIKVTDDMTFVVSRHGQGFKVTRE